MPPAAPQLRAGVSDDLLVPWGWLEVALFVILAVIASVVVTWGVAEIAVRFFGVKPDECVRDHDEHGEVGRGAHEPGGCSTASRFCIFT